MSYETYEQSAEGGRPKYRVLFVAGDTEYAYTNDEVITSDSSYTWLPESIEFSEFSQTNEMAKDPLKITLPRDNAFALLFQGGVPEQVVTVTVFRFHTNDATEEYQFYWKGRIAGVTNEGDATKLECENVFTSLRRPGLREKYQIGCRHSLYGRGCGLDKDDFAVEIDVTAASGKTITFTHSFTSMDSNYFAGGMIKTTDGFYRNIIQNNDTTLYLIHPLLSLNQAVSDSGPQSAIIYPGCAHSMIACSEKFNNIKNYGGCPWLPSSKNPFDGDITGSIA